MIDDIGTVYLIHFDKKYRHTQHYIGFTVDPKIASCRRKILAARLSFAAKLISFLEKNI